MMEVNRIGRSSIHDAFLVQAGSARLDPAEGAALLPADGARLSLLFPGEHCTECAAPDCHDTCDLFERSRVGRCRRFVDGLVATWSATGPIPYTLEAIFKPSARLLCVGNAYCVTPRACRRLAVLALLCSRASYRLQELFRFLPARAQWRVTDKILGLGNRLPRFFNALSARGWGGRPESLLAVIGNPGAEEIRVEISLSGFGDSQKGRSLQRVVVLPHGWRSVTIPVSEIRPVIDLNGLFRICVVPLIERPALLQFSYLGFVARAGRERRTAAWAAAPSGEKNVKLLVTDLDNTLWDGVLIENPDGDYALLPGVRETLEELDRRGVLLSIASRNNPEDAKAVLELLGIWDLFLHPRINWEPKSANVRRIAEELNVGVDTVAFVDDMEFERAEVRAALPDVRTYPAAAFAGLPSLEAFTVPVTGESRQRRRLYHEESRRREEFRGSDADYDAFLASCNIRLHLGPLTADNRERVFELVQRTNQLNFSGNRYSRESLDELTRAPGLLPVVMRCEDRFGDYGIVGFAILRVSGNALEMTDLMFSCRIQGKKVEHGFLACLAEQAGRAGLERVVCRYVRTPRNTPAARVFEDLGFAKEAEADPSGREPYSLSCAGARFPALPVKVVDEASVLKRIFPSP
jgi:FkbH-like protein